MAEHQHTPYDHVSLPTETSFRVLELFPGKADDPVTCSLRVVDWSEPPEYEAVSYAWGDPNVKVPVSCDGRKVDVTVNLETALTHLRFEDRSRILWADAICIDQLNLPERGRQVKQMRKIYENAKAVLIWLGSDAQGPRAEVAINSIRNVSDFLCEKLEVSIPDLSSMHETCQELVLKNRTKLPSPDHCPLGTEAVWKSLIWFYSHPYFSRVWVIQEIGANKMRLVHCGHEKTEWERVDLVACYMIMEPAFSEWIGFSNTYCWWAASVTELVRQPENWLAMLYLASNFSCLDPRDVIYGLRGLMKLSGSTDILDPDYGKSDVEVYRDFVQAALERFQNTNVLLYISGNEDPSWIPRWDIPMLFRNPFRFGKAVPWKPAPPETTPLWNIDQDKNVLSLSGFHIDTILAVEPYNESIFGAKMINSTEGRGRLREVWQTILRTVDRTAQSRLPFSTGIFTAAATSFSYGLNENTDPADERYLVLHFVAYLRMVLDQDTFNIYVPSDLAEESRQTDGNAFGKPVWDFQYPDSSFLITRGGLLGCSVATAMPGDIVYVALGSTYPMILRPDGERFSIRGYAYVHGAMHWEQEREHPEIREFKIH